MRAGEMWIGVTLAVGLELVPTPLRASAVGVYLFIISNVGGNMTLLVPPLSRAFYATHRYSYSQSLRGLSSSIFVLRESKMSVVIDTRTQRSVCRLNACTTNGFKCFIKCTRA